MPLTPFLRLVATTLAPSLLFADGELFEDLSFDQALARAAQDEKIVLVDFYTSWCAPCKKLDELTWPDEDVVAWVSEHTVPLKVDAEKEADLAGRYEVGAYPTLLFVRPDGGEMGRLVGFMGPERLLSAAADLLAGIRPVDRARERLEREGWENPVLRAEYAGLLARGGEHEEALAHYLWCFDRGAEVKPSYGPVRVSFLPHQIARLGKSYPEALKELRKRRDAVHARVLEGTATPTQASEFTSINAALGEAGLTLRAFDELSQGSPGPDREGRRAVRKRLFEAVFGLLIEERRYADVVAMVGNVVAAVEAELEKQEGVAAAVKSLRGDSELEEMLDMLTHGTVRECASYYEAVVGVGGRDGEAQRVADMILEFAPGGETVAELALRAERAGRSDVAERLRTSAREAVR